MIAHKKLEQNIDTLLTSLNRDLKKTKGACPQLSVIVLLSSEVDRLGPLEWRRVFVNDPDRKTQIIDAMDGPGKLFPLGAIVVTRHLDRDGGYTLNFQAWPTSWTTKPRLEKLLHKFTKDWAQTIEKYQTEAHIFGALKETELR
jgi:hypothetical protein